jgi:hypothetical protein
MKSSPGKRRGFLIASISTGVVLALCSGLWLAFGPAIVTDVYEGRSLGFLNDLIERPPTRSLRSYLTRSQSTFEAILASALALYVLTLGLVGARRLRWRWPGVLALFLVWWIGVELFAAPHLARQLELQFFYFIRDVDHQPKKAGFPGWNSDSLRIPREPQEFTPESSNLIFLGDSFTFGHLLPPQRAFPQKVEGLLRERHPEWDVKAANFGWNSSSPLLSYRRLEAIGEKYHPDWVVMCVDMTDFQDDIKYRNMLDRRGIYWFYDKIPIALSALKRCLPGVFEWLNACSNGDMPRERYFMVKAPLEETRKHMRPLAENLGRIARWCDEREVGFAVVVLPRSFQYSDREAPRNWEVIRDKEYEALGPFALEPFRFFDELRGQVAYPVHSLLETFRDAGVFPTCFEHDPHWNDAGTTIAARAIAAILEREMAAPPVR